MITKPRLSFSALVVLSWALLAMAVLSGCITQSIYPIYDSKILTFDERLVGAWVSDAEEISWVFEKDGSRGYTLVFYSEDEAQPLELEARMVRIGETLFLDLYLDEVPNDINNLIGVFTLPLHTILRVDKIDDELKMSELRASWLKDQLEDDPDAIEHVFVDGRAVLTAETGALQRFFAAVANENDAWEGAIDMRRAEPASPADR
ncbi:MAG: hypothetical protein IH849_13025 [Acidobacteria bacterium]|nr:hypothetical protein [Acidobacteriota bacterium]